MATLEEQKLEEEIKKLRKEVSKLAEETDSVILANERLRGWRGYIRAVVAGIAASITIFVFYDNVYKEVATQSDKLQKVNVELISAQNKLDELKLEKDRTDALNARDKLKQELDSAQATFNAEKAKLSEQIEAAQTQIQDRNRELSDAKKSLVDQAAKLNAQPGVNITIPPTLTAAAPPVQQIPDFNEIPKVSSNPAPNPKTDFGMLITMELSNYVNTPGFRLRRELSDGDLNKVAMVVKLHKEEQILGVIFTGLGDRVVFTDKAIRTHIFIGDDVTVSYLSLVDATIEKGFLGLDVVIGGSQRISSAGSDFKTDDLLNLLKKIQATTKMNARKLLPV
jgi:hypothetical protein